MHKHIENTGFRPPAGRALGREHRSVACAQLVTTIVLAVSTVIVATVLSVGVARANVAGNIIGHEDSLFAIALLLGLVFIGLGGVSMMSDKTGKH